MLLLLMMMMSMMLGMYFVAVIRLFRSCGCSSGQLIIGSGLLLLGRTRVERRSLADTGRLRTLNITIYYDHCLHRHRIYFPKSLKKLRYIIR